VTPMRSLLAVLAALLAFPAFADYPEKPVRIVVPYAAGGPTDTVARVIAERLAERWKQQVIVENKPGAAGVIGVQAVLASPADGYTLLLHATSGLTIYQALQKTPAYDTLRDLTPISKASFSPLVLVAHPSMPFSDVKSLLAYAKQNSGKLAFASAGIGALNHIGGELLKLQTGADMVHVPYKGDAPAVADLLNGNVPIAFLSSNLALPQVEAGKLKGLAVTSAARIDAAPSLPTMIEAGLPEFELTAWNAFLGPAGLPRAIVDKVNGDLVDALGRQETRKRLAELGLTTKSGSPDELANDIRNEIAKWRAVVASARIQPE
jgi:tripartite-type tricarboxylate transporter receptor subunit TctC